MRSRLSYFYRAAGVMILAGFTVRCSSTPKQFLFTSPDKLTVDLVSFEDPLGAGEPLGATPATVPLAKVTSGKLVRVSSPGKLPFYWSVQESLGQKTQLKISLLDSPKTSATSFDGTARVQRQLANRLIFKAYSALAQEDLDVAIELATKAADLDKELAAPHIIQGMAFLKLGKPQEAKKALVKAQALDPEDSAIEALIKAAPL